MGFWQQAGAGSEDVEALHREGGRGRTGVGESKRTLKRQLEREARGGIAMAMCRREGIIQQD